MVMEDWMSSYVLGNDTQSGWGQRYFFTYYSEWGSRKTAANFEIVILLVTFVFSVVANLSIAAVVLRYREMRTVTNCFLLNLSLADLLFAAGIPLVTLARVLPRWQLGSLTCRLLPYSQFVCGFVLLWTLTLISMDRHRCLVVPPYRSKLTPRRAAVLTLATWLVAAILFLPVAAWFQYYSEIGICTLVFPHSDIINVSICFVIPVIFFTLLPMSLLVFHYQRIFHKLLKTRSRWTIAPVEPPRRTCDKSRKFSLQHFVYPGKSSALSHHEELRLHKHIRVIRILLLNVLVILLMWLPITVVMFLIFLDGRRPTEDTGFFLRSHHFIWALLIALLNTVVNPILFGVLSENFRAYLSRMWFGTKRHHNVSNFIEDGVSRGKTPSFGRHLTPASVPSVTDLPSGCAL